MAEKIRVAGVTAVKITGEYIKLDSFLKLAGVAGTGGAAKAMIADGAVRVNGETASERGKKLRSGAVVAVGGRAYVIGTET
ncbi:MAG: RNA-binding S4 domain-containing protein [Oscillospiraceae bacterium]|jgi:ribosome-associated protein|nr:RNA-binding S4 domain-containing protein [Oscillospiraceae bacterium]